MISALPCQFLDSHGVMGFILGLDLDCWKVLDLGEVVSGKYPRVADGDVFLQKALNSWVETRKLLKGC